MKAHYHYTTAITAGGSTSVFKQVNLTPSMIDFDQLVNQAQFYQQYTLKRVDYKLRVLNQQVGGMGTRLPTGVSQPVSGALQVFRVRL